MLTLISVCRLTVTLLGRSLHLHLQINQINQSSM